jgi:hypothetical protein
MKLVEFVPVLCLQNICYWLMQSKCFERKIAYSTGKCSIIRNLDLNPDESQILIRKKIVQIHNTGYRLQIISTGCFNVLVNYRCLNYAKLIRVGNGYRYRLCEMGVDTRNI